MFTQAITEMIDAKILKIRPSPYQKWWWSKALSMKQTEVHRLEQRAYRRRTSLKDPIHHEHKTVQLMYASMIESSKKSHWEDFLESVDERTVWTAHWYASGDPIDDGKVRVPTLKVKQADGSTQVAETNAEKGQML